MIYVYSHKVTRRLKYTLDVLLKNVLQVKYTLLDKELFVSETTFPKINYSDEKLPDSIWIEPHALLFEKDIKEQDIRVTHIRNIAYFFKTNDLADSKFDILASSFYMLTRYEEYLAFTPDEYGRFSAEQSLAYRANFLKEPIVQLWALQLQRAILKHRPDFLFPTRIFTQLNTIDIDIAYAYRGKPFFRRLGSLTRALLHFNLEEIKQHFFFISNGKDSYDTYPRLKNLQKKSNAKSLYFFQVGSHGKYDKNLPINNVMIKLISKVAKYAEIGLHPSYVSNTDFLELKEEFQDLSEIVGKPITKSRQHYLKLDFPQTYEKLIRLGIKEDYTLGFPDKIGFRAGMALPYAFFNLQTNKQRPLTIVPFQIMDGTLKDYLKLTPNEALQKVEELKNAVKQVNGQLVSIFHNSTVTNQGEWKGWLEIYREVLK